MPSVNDVVELIQALESKPILAVQDKCVAVRNRNSSCKKCVEACPIEGAIRTEKNALVIDTELCVACGACTAVCPTEALVPLTPMDADLADQVASAYLEADTGQALIACARIASKHIADPHKFAQVPCVCRVDESLIVGLAARGVREIALVDGVCRTCKYRATQVTTDAIVASANDLLQTWGSDTRVVRMSEFPESVLLHDDRKLYGEDRRNFFGEAKETAKDAALAAANQTLKLENDKAEVTLRDRLAVGAGKMPQFNAVRRMNMLDSLDRIGEPQKESIDTLLWGRVEIDMDTCNGCGMCTVFCPTGALVKAAADDMRASETNLVMEFSCSDCVHCDLCADACFRNCLTVSDHVLTDELLDFEPRSFVVKGFSNKPLIGMGQTDFRA